MTCPRSLAESVVEQGVASRISQLLHLGIAKSRDRVPKGSGSTIPAARRHSKVQDSNTCAAASHHEGRAELPTGTRPVQNLGTGFSQYSPTSECTTVNRQ